MSVIELLKQMMYVIPTIIAAASTLTAAIKGVFTIKNDVALRAINWTLGVATACLFVLCNGLSFGLGNWDYAVAAVCGVIVGICTNGLYTWDSIRALMDAIVNLFGKKA